MSETKPKVILAYSGGLDTSVILKWLCEKGFEVIAFCANVGQFEEDFSAVKAKAESVGATTDQHNAQAAFNILGSVTPAVFRGQPPLADNNYHVFI